ncbi:MAG TPA: DUF2252 domain-containing protein [Nevskia sp.]|nr:DUF2252 domain-containing protein [Nevskia sp.]
MKSKSQKKKAVPVVEQHPGRPYLLPVEDRLAAGKALRERCTRKAHGLWKAPPKRTDPIELLLASDRGRLPELVPIRYGRMMVSPFTYYRGAAPVMAHDLSGTAVTGLKLQACGDCHLLNFGGFATPERKVVFDINDFDETAISFWEWDVKRLAASFVLAGRANGFDDAQCAEAAWYAAQTYRRRMAEYSRMSVLEAWYASLDLEELIESGQDETFKQYSRDRLAAADSLSTHAHDLAKLTYELGETPRIIDNPPLVYHQADLQKHQDYHRLVEEAFGRYRHSLLPARRLLLDRYRIVDVALKVVGIGSVGTECGIVLLMSGNGDSLFLQYKEARASVLEPYSGACPYGNHGQRVVAGQQIMQSASDQFLGWTEGENGRQFYIRQLRDVKVKPVIEAMKPANLRHYARSCGWALARAHARSGDAVTLTGYMGKGDAFEDALTGFACSYADQTERDHALLRRAIRAGRVHAVKEGL